ncbi:hypothetical protein [Hafnia paralvei]|uniref:hypothetical protein n=1 Tax=Hafnia paralvei TaxID=546367 RepID=UPI0029D95A25|nr:hypothetical protein [Hafnia paralvei]MDX6839373.1 hypothetical protein [Hafnia paralvei]
MTLDIRTLKSYQVVALFNKGEKLICPRCKTPLDTIPPGRKPGEEFIGLNCPKNQSHFLVKYRKLEQVTESRDVMKQIVEEEKARRELKK